MGEIADDIIDSFIGDWENDYPYKQRRKRGFQHGAGQGMWRSKEGVIPMSAMTTRHICNALAVCERTGNTEKKKELELELKRRSDQHPVKE